MKKAFLCIALLMLIALGICFTVFNLAVFLANTQHTGYLVIAILGALESVMCATALFLYLKAKKGKYVDTIYVIAEVLCLPTLFLFIVWIGLCCVNLLSSHVTSIHCVKGDD